MSIISILLIAVGLAMDAFAVSMTIGITCKKQERLKMALKAGIFFGGFQGLMPFIGWCLGIKFTDYIQSIDHWIAFVLLAIIGGKMFIEGLKGEEEEQAKEYDNKSFIILAIATSIDALAVGVSFAFLNVSILSAIIIIPVVTFILSIIAVYIGKALGELFKSRAEMLGGIILVAIGVKILVEHLFM